MRRKRIALLVILVLAVPGAFLIQRAWVGAAESASPEASSDSGNHDEPKSGSEAPLHRSESSGEREQATSGPLGVPSSRLLVRVRELGRGAVVEGASVAVHPANVVAETLEAAGAASDIEPRFDVFRNPAGEPDALTDDRGEALLEVPSGIGVLLQVRGLGPEGGTSDLAVPALSPSESREVLVDLPRGHDLEHWVRVVAAAEGKPVEGAAVRLWTDTGSVSVPAQAVPVDQASPTLTGPDGVARVPVPSCRSVLLRVDAAGFGPILAVVLPGHDDESRAQVLGLSRSATLSLRVTSSAEIPLVDAEIVAASSFAEITVPRRATPYRSRLEWSARTDARGICRIEGLPPEVPVQVEIRREAQVLLRLAEPLVLAPGEVMERSVRLGDAARVHGMLLGALTGPVPGVEIWLSRAPTGGSTSAADQPGLTARATDRYSWVGTLEVPFASDRTDAQGRFAFEGVQSGDWWVGPAPSLSARNDDGKGSIAPRAVSVHVPAAGEVEVVLLADPALSIRGKVVDAQGVPVANTVVEARAEDALGSLSARTSTVGEFTLGPLAAGAFQVKARGRWGMTDSEEATVRAGDRDVVLRLSPGALLRGRVVDLATGNPCVATVSLGSSGADARAAVAYAGRDGAFEFKGLRAGAYDLVGRSDDGRVGVLRDVTVRVGSASPGTVLSLAPGANLRIVHGGTLGWGRFTVLSQGRILASGSLRAGASALVSVPIEPLTVRFVSEGAPAVERTIEPNAGGEATEIVFTSG